MVARIETGLDSVLMQRVKDMHEKFGIKYDGPPRSLSKEEREFRITCLQEELDEYKAGGTHVDQYDALLDLIVFAIGTLYRQGFPLLEGFNAVMDANMTKHVGPNEKRNNFSIDLVKPRDFISPEYRLYRILINKDREHNIGHTFT